MSGINRRIEVLDEVKIRDDARLWGLAKDRSTLEKWLPETDLVWYRQVKCRWENGEIETLWGIWGAPDAPPVGRELKRTVIRNRPEGRYRRAGSFKEKRGDLWG